ncbi:MAG TPA: hypothetical protein VEH57_06675 [Thermoplasmata archaeon]|nr:hypothetical protein [Thermoplasmata archaeon]
MKRATRRQRFLGWTIAAVAALVVVLLVLVGLGILSVAPDPPAKTLTVVGAERWIDQGTTASGRGWFGPSYYNYTVPDGFPIVVPVGGTFALVVTFSNFDNQTHTLYSAVANTPFSVSGSRPALPSVIPPRQDEPVYEFLITVPNEPGARLWLNVTLDALS